MKKAEITAFLSLIFILLVSFVGALMESASIQMTKNYRRADMNRAMESVFAEYQKELLEEYEVFALEGSYESGKYSEDLLLSRMEYYGAENIENKIERIQFLTDNGAQTFYEQVTYYMQHKYGVDKLTDKISMTDTWKAQEERAEDYQQESQESEDKYQQMLSESDGSLPEEDNPIAYVSQLKKKSLLDLIMPDDKSVSKKSISLSDTASHRSRNKGYGDFSDVAKESGTLSSLLFGEYLLEHFQNASDDGQTGALDYEIEYICAGKASDKENLESVAKKLMLIRFASNYIFLQGSSAKKAEAEALALTLCTLAMLPALEQAATQMILLSWAFGESVVDLRALLQGSKVPLVKSEESWQLSLSGLMKLGESGDINDGKDNENGLSYMEYLRMLLFLEKRQKVGMRTLDMIEQNLRKTHGLKFFRADYCVSRMEVKSVVSLRRGVTYRFQTYYGYN